MTSLPPSLENIEPRTKDRAGLLLPPCPGCSPAPAPPSTPSYKPRAMATLALWQVAPAHLPWQHLSYREGRHVCKERLAGDQVPGEGGGHSGGPQLVERIFLLDRGGGGGWASRRTKQKTNARRFVIQLVLFQIKFMKNRCYQIYYFIKRTGLLSVWYYCCWRRKPVYTKKLFSHVAAQDAAQTYQPYI